MMFVDRVQATARAASQFLPFRRAINPFAIIAQQQAFEAAARERAKKAAKTVVAMPEAPGFVPAIATAMIARGDVEGAINYAVAMSRPAAVPGKSAAKESPAKSATMGQILRGLAESRVRRAETIRARKVADAVVFYTHARRIAPRVYYLAFCGSQLRNLEHEIRSRDGRSVTRWNHGRKVAFHKPRRLAGTRGRGDLGASRSPVVDGLGYHTPRRLARLVEGWDIAAS